MSNIPSMDDFFTLDYKVRGDYEKIQQLMGVIYSQMQEGKEIDAKELLSHLSDISRSMLNTQRDFIDIYADDSIKAQLHYKVDSKEQALMLSENELKGKSL